MSTKSKKAKTPKRGRPAGSVNSFDVNLSAAIREAIEVRKRFVHHRELVDALTRKVGKSKIKDPVEFARKTSVLIHSLKTRNVIAQYSASDSTRDRYYGKAEWIKRGKVAPEFAPKS